MINLIILFFKDQYIYIYECVNHLIDKIKKENSNDGSEDSRIKTEGKS